jgi:hypothetical protein
VQILAPLPTTLNLSLPVAACKPNQSAHNHVDFWLKLIATENALCLKLNATGSQSSVLAQIKGK